MQKVLLSFFVVFCCSVIVGAVIFLKQGSAEQVQAANLATCKTGFDRPLLFGVNIPLSDKASQRVTDVGGTATRVGFNWDDMEPQRGQYNLTLMDGLANDAHAKGLVMVGLISGTPDWAARDPGRDNHRSFPKTSERETYKNFVKQLVTKHKDKIRYWSFWNEPNGCGSSAPDCSFSGSAMEEYIYWLNATYEAVKEVDNSMQVVGGELDYWRQVPDHVKFMVDKGAKFDIISIHPYDKDNNGVDFAGIRSAHEKSGNKPVWLTEYGWGGTDTPDSPADAAKWMKQMFDELKKPEYSYVQAAFYHEIFDYNDGEQGLSDKNPTNGEFRINGQAFRDAAISICDPQLGDSSGAASPSVTPGAGNISVRTYYQASSLSSNGQNWPKMSLYLNNAAGYNASIPLDELPCDGSVTDMRAKCGSLNLFKEKLIAEYEVAGTTYKTDHTIPISRIVENLGDNIGITKLSYVFHNDESSNTQDRNVWITKIEFYGPDGKLILTYEADESEKNYKVTPLLNQNRPLESLYYDMGFVNSSGESVPSGSNAQNGMVKAFDKKELRNLTARGGPWELKQEGSFNLVTMALHTVIVQNYGGTTAPACVVATADNQGIPVKRGQPITLSSVATVPIHTVQFAFYNAHRKDANGFSQPYCVAGATKKANDGCPEGSGQLIVTTKVSDRPGVLQAVDWLKLPSNQVVQSFWKGDIGSNRQVPWDANFGGSASVTWNYSNHVGGLAIGQFTYPSTPEIDAMTTYSTNNKIVTMEMWRNNQLWYNVVPFTDNGTNLDWGRAEGWKKFTDLNETPTFFPGTGLVTARSSFVSNNKLYHIYWRGSEEWMRIAPIVNGVVDGSQFANDPAKGYKLARSVTNLKGTGKVQGMSHMVMPDGSVQEQIWQGNQMWKRTLRVIASGPDFSNTNYQGPLKDGLTPVSDRSASQTLEYNQVYFKDTATQKFPEFLQVNATFLTADNKTIGNDGKCVVRFNFDKAISGDFNGDCKVDIYDYNLLAENFGKTNCGLNLNGDCTIDDTDIALFLPRFSSTCENPRP